VERAVSSYRRNLHRPVEWSKATITLTQAPNSQTVIGTYQDGIESYSFTGNGYGDSVLITSQTGGTKIINYFAFDGGPTAQVYFYGFDGSYLGTIQPPGFP
jgi:hypothetical protein